MNWIGMRNRLRAVVTERAIPSLRVIGMAYTGLFGVIAVGVVVSVAFLPVPPALQQATEPAREAVGNIVQPATDAVASLITSQIVPAPPSFLFMPAPVAAAPSAVPTEVALNEGQSDEPVATDEPTLQTARSVVASRILRKPAVVVAPDPVVEDVPVDEPAQPAEPIQQPPVQAVAEAVPDAPVLQAANAELPKPLPPVPTPTETPRQARARLDVENQAAINAAKAAAVRHKLEADAANQAAIDLQRAALARGPRVVAVAAPTAVVQPLAPPPVPLPVATPEPVRADAVVKPAGPVVDAEAFDKPASAPVKGIVVRTVLLEEAPIMLAQDEQNP